MRSPIFVVVFILVFVQRPGDDDVERGTRVSRSVP